MAQIETIFEFQIKGGELVLIGGFDETEYIIEEIDNYVQPEYNDKGYIIQDFVEVKKNDIIQDFVEVKKNGVTQDFVETRKNDTIQSNESTAPIFDEDDIFKRNTDNNIAVSDMFGDEEYSNKIDEEYPDKIDDSDSDSRQNNNIDSRQRDEGYFNKIDEEYPDKIDEEYSYQNNDSDSKEIMEKTLRKDISDEDLFIRIMEENLSSDDPVMVEEYAQGDEYLSEDIDEFFGGDKLDGLGWMV